MTSSTVLTQRMATSSAEAAAGYATAAVAAYVDWTNQVMGFWANTLDSMMGAAQPRSWYRHPDNSARTRPFGPMGFAFTPTTPPYFGAGAPARNPGNAAATMLNPFGLWLKAWPLQGNPAAWPMAFAMMGMGLPRSVAYPLAEANTAAMDAVQTANRAMNESFSAYRSDGGHASAQIRFQTSTAIAALMAPLGLYAVTPWFTAIASWPQSF